MSVLFAGLLLASTTLPAQAALVGTDTVLNEARADADRTELIQMLQGDEVRDRLEAMGVDPANAEERVQRMTDAELAQLQQHMDEAPAGGDALGVALTVFIVFVITDVIGATDIFPFIRSVD
ncbi:MAG: DUF6627 family protein [Halofilum sp. (in: g-proteobacteria)]